MANHHFAVVKTTTISLLYHSLTLFVKSKLRYKRKIYVMHKKLCIFSVILPIEILDFMCYNVVTNRRYGPMRN